MYKKLSFLTAVATSSLIFMPFSSGRGAGVASLPSAAGQPLRYHLAVGEELIYRVTGSSRSTTDTTQPADNSITDYTFRVTGVNADGSWHVIQSAQEQRTSLPPGTQEPPQIDSFDLTPDGHVKMDPSFVMAFQPPVAFPQLPPDGTAKSWQGNGQCDDETTSFVAAPTTGSAAWNVDSQTVSLFTRLYEWIDTSHLRFDRARGLLIHSSEHVAEPLYNQVEDITLDLTSSQNRPVKWIAKYGAQVEVLLAAQKQYDKMVEAADAAGDASPATTDPALAVLTAAKSKVTLPELSPVLEATIANHPSTISSIKDSAQELAAIVDKPAPAWDLRDLAGASHSLAGLRGKVVVLDFWYRGCGWCMRAMPQMKQLAQDYRDKPVAILGMNVDSQDKDAQFVADFFKLPYPTLRTTMATDAQPAASPTNAASQPVPATTYHVQGYPTLFIIGPDGILRVRHVGFSPTLHDDIAKQINAILTSARKAR